MSDLLSKEQRRALTPEQRAKAQRTSQVSSAAAAPDDWYDQGFDLDAASSAPVLHDDGFGVNPALLEDAAEQITEASKNRLRSDAEMQLKDGSVQITMDPLSPVREISTGRQQLSAREGEIEVGGNGRIFERSNAQHAHVQSEYLGPRVKSSLEQELESGPIYSEEYLAKKSREAAEAAAAARERAAIEAAENSDYRTVVHHEKNYTNADSRFIHSLREQQADREASLQGAAFGLNSAQAAEVAASSELPAGMTTADLIKASTYKGPSAGGRARSNLQAASDYLGPKPQRAEVKQVGSVYSPEYLAQKSREAAEAAAVARERAAIAAAENSDYRTVVLHGKGLTDADTRFMQSLREQQSEREAEAEGASFGLTDSEVASIEAKDARDAQAARDAAAALAEFGEAKGQPARHLTTEELVKASTYKGPSGGRLRPNLQAASDYLGPKPQRAEVKQVGTVYSPEYLAQKEREAKEHEALLARGMEMSDEDIAAMQAREAAAGAGSGAGDSFGAGSGGIWSDDGVGEPVVAGNLHGAQATSFGGHGSLLSRRQNLNAASDYLGPKSTGSDLRNMGTVYSDQYLSKKERELAAKERKERALQAELAAQDAARKFDMSDGDIAAMQAREAEAAASSLAQASDPAWDSFEGGAVVGLGAGTELPRRGINAGAGAGKLPAAKGSGDDIDPAWWGEDIDFGGTVYRGPRPLGANDEAALGSGGRGAGGGASSSQYLDSRQRAEVQQVGSIYSPEYAALREREAAHALQDQESSSGDIADPNGDYRTRVEHSSGMSLEESRFLQSLRQAQSKQEPTPEAAPATLAQSQDSAFSEDERQKLRSEQQNRLKQHSTARNLRAAQERQQSIAAQQARLKQMRQRQLQEQQERQLQSAQEAQARQAGRMRSSGTLGDGGEQELTGVAAAEARAAAQTMSYSEAIKDEYTTKGALELRKMREQELAQSPHGAKPKSNSEKTLEELAREYPGLSPEHLVKLKRSSNRCHLVSRTPVFDANSNISMYELKFTAGKVFQVNALKSDHVYHVLFGYFIRRGISCFIGRNKSALVMMPITYDFLDYIDRYSVNRVVLRICPEQPVTPSALHILTKLRRAGMSFAIDLMVLLKRDWNKAVLSIEYVMIDMSAKVREQLSVFQRLKIKAPWLKTIGYNDVNGDGYAYLAKHMIDFLDAPFWNVGLKFNQDVSFFAPLQQEVMGVVHELFKEQPNYAIFQQFLRAHEGLSRDMAVFLYRFRHASPRQVQNISELFHFLLDYSPSRSFSVMAGRTIMLSYVKAVNIASQSILQEHYSQAIIRGYFVEYMSKIFDDPFVSRYAFQCGMFSLLHLFLLKEEVDVIADDQYADIFDRIYGESELMADIIECVQAIEATNLNAIFDFIHKYNVPPASVLISYEKALMRTNEMLLVLNIVSSHK